MDGPRSRLANQEKSLCDLQIHSFLLNFLHELLKSLLKILKYFYYMIALFLD